MSDSDDTSGSGGPLESDPFVVSVSKWIARAKTLQVKALQAGALDLLTRVKQLTPVDTGYLRANWTVMPAGHVLPVAGQVPDPTVAIAALRAGDSIVLANPVVYARRIEYGFVGEDKLGRTYDQKGAGMMTQTLKEMPDIFQKATARVMGES